MEELIFKYIGEKNFRGYTLTQDDLQLAALKMVAVILAVFMWTLSLKPSEKQLAWVVSLINSFVMAITGTMYAIIILPKIVVPLLKFEGLDPWQVFEAPITNFTALQCMWFAIANIIDLGLGMFFYRKYLHFLTAWVHHSVFIWLMYASTTGDTLFYKTKPFTSSFAIVVIEEIPTFLLALGSIFPMFRSDLGFGITFFILRIVYHSLFMMCAFYNIGEIDNVILGLYAGTLMLHVNWFNTWQKKYGFVAKEHKKQSPGIRWTPPERTKKVE